MESSTIFMVSSRTRMTFWSMASPEKSTTRIFSTFCDYSRKSLFGVAQLEYLGYFIDGTGIRPDVKRVAALQDAPRPSSIKALQSFLGFTQYYAKFVRNFSAAAKPLFDMVATQGDGTFEWSTEAECSYKSLLQAIPRSCPAVFPDEQAV